MPPLGAHAKDVVHAGDVAARRREVEPPAVARPRVQPLEPVVERQPLERRRSRASGRRCRRRRCGRRRTRAVRRRASRAAATRWPRATRAGARRRRRRRPSRCRRRRRTRSPLGRARSPARRKRAAARLLLDSWPLWLDIPNGCIAPSSASPAIASARLVNPAAIPAAAGWLCLTDVLLVCPPILRLTARWVCEKTVSPSYDGSSGCNFAEPPIANGSLAHASTSRLNPTSRASLKVKRSNARCGPVLSPPYDTRPTHADGQ